MAQTSDQIVMEIELERERLAGKIDELEYYVRDKADVRAYYERKPWTFVGSAALGGVVLAMMMLGGGRKSR
jgi:hypothetical protein